MWFCRNAHHYHANDKPRAKRFYLLHILAVPGLLVVRDQHRAIFDTCKWFDDYWYENIN